MRMVCLQFFFVTQKTAYEVRISDWVSGVCSSDLSSSKATRTLRSSCPTGGSMFRSRRVTVNSLRATFPVQSSVSRRSEESRVGKECVSTCRSRWSQYHTKTNEVASIANPTTYHN